ncbi:unnamed protein product [Prorocentrum cordatum]|uniref:Uncharacterized protein n=1 Tax=Prorocentrum cordatum TaxID=2364126 RepID=A0ABN9WKI0_9DINO|nr:unnamed protein product [Polarella glacialis]
MANRRCPAKDLSAPAPTEQERICRPAGGAQQPPHLPRAPLAAGPAADAYAGAFGRGAAGATHSFSPAALQQAGLAAPAPLPHSAPPPAAAAAAPAAAAPAAAAAAPAAEPEDLLIFEDTVEASSPSSADLLSFGDGASAASSAGPEEGPAEAAELKRRGNALVKERRPGEAIRQYEAALALLAPGSHEPLRAVLFANVALCCLQQQLYRRAVEAATRSLEADAGHAKAHYRRCLAHRALKMFEEARRDLDALGRCRHELAPEEMRRLAASLQAPR